jgi:hypothetical protein
MSEETGLVRLSQDCALTCHSPGLRKRSSRGHRHKVGEDPDCPNNPGLMDGTILLFLAGQVAGSFVRGYADDDLHASPFVRGQVVRNKFTD